MATILVDKKLLDVKLDGGADVTVVPCNTFLHPDLQCSYQDFSLQGARDLLHDKQRPCRNLKEFKDNLKHVKALLFLWLRPPAKWDPFCCRNNAV